MLRNTSPIATVGECGHGLANRQKPWLALSIATVGGGVWSEDDLSCSWFYSWLWCGYGGRNHGNVVWLAFSLFPITLVGKYTETLKLQEQLP